MKGVHKIYLKTNFRSAMPLMGLLRIQRNYRIYYRLVIIYLLRVGAESSGPSRSINILKEKSLLKFFIL